MTCVCSLFFVLLFGQNLFNNPESVVFDATNNRYLVSNAGDGNIVQVNTLSIEATEDNASTIYEYFNTELFSVRGMHILDQTLYVASDSGIVGFDLATKKKIKTIKITEAKFLNDITSDKDGFLYVSDTNAKMIFKADPQNLSYVILVSSGIGKPNGLLYDKNKHRLIVCAWQFNAPIYGVDLSTGVTTQLIKTTFSNLDGLAMDKWGFIYVSSWGANGVLRFDPEFKLPPVKVSKGHQGPADICINPFDQLLIIPNFNSDKIVHERITPFTKQ